jgi:hypothetical protein
VVPVSELHGPINLFAPIPGTRAFYLGSSEGLIKRYDFDQMTSERVTLPDGFHADSAIASPAGVVFVEAQHYPGEYLNWGPGTRVLVIKGDASHLIDLGHNVTQAALVDDDVLVYVSSKGPWREADRVQWYSLSQKRVIKSTRSVGALISADGSTVVIRRRLESESGEGRPEMIVADHSTQFRFQTIPLADDGKGLDLVAQQCLPSLDGERLTCTEASTMWDRSDGQRAVTRVYDTESGAVVFESQVLPGTVGNLVSPDGMHLITTNSEHSEWPSNGLLRLDGQFRNDQARINRRNMTDDEEWIGFLFSGEAVVHDYHYLWTDAP